MSDYYADYRAAAQVMYSRTGAAYSWTDADGIRWTLNADGRRFAFVGDYTVREGRDGYSVTRDIDGDEVRVADGMTGREAVALAKAQA